MWRANKWPPRIALSEFYNKALSDNMDVQAEYVAWRQSRVSGLPVKHQSPELSRDPATEQCIINPELSGGFLNWH